MRIYLDACCLNRPFDDQSQDRIRLESEAVKIALDLCSKGTHSWVISDVLEGEIERNPNFEKRDAVKSVLKGNNHRLVINDFAVEIARRVMAFGIRAMDALHLGLAEAAGCDIILTVDDDLILRSRKIQPPLSIRIENPVQWVDKAVRQP